MSKAVGGDGAVDADGKLHVLPVTMSILTNF